MKRRDFLKGTTALAASIALPVVPTLPGSVIGVDLSTKPDQTIFMLSTPTGEGEWIRHEFMRAQSDVYKSFLLPAEFVEKTQT